MLSHILNYYNRKYIFYTPSANYHLKTQQESIFRD